MGGARLATHKTKSCGMANLTVKIFNGVGLHVSASPTYRTYLARLWRALLLFPPWQDKYVDPPKKG